MSAEDQDIAQQLKDLQADAAWLLHNQTSLDARLERVEQSLVFRTLRALSRKFRSRKKHRPAPGKTSREASLELAEGVDLIYADEQTPHGPLFKPDWSPVLLRSVNYLGAQVAIRPEHQSGSPDLVSAARALRNPTVIHLATPRLTRHVEAIPPPPVTPSPPPTDAQISLIICTRNARLLEICLAGLHARTDHPNWELIVVQHIGSSSAAEEAAVARIIAQHKAKRVIYQQPFNFAEMNNRGAEAAAGSILLFLNDDIDPLKPDWVRRMTSWLKDPAIGAVGAKLTFPDGALQHAGIAAYMTAGAWHPGRRCPPSPLWPWLAYTREVSAVTGACLAIRSDDFRRMNGFDPAFPVNFNDVDLCFRLQESGLSVIVDMEAELRHDESRTRTAGSTYNERRLFFRKWQHRLTRPDPFYSPNLAQNTEEILLP